MPNISVVVLTGLSGAGKSVAANSLEDMGFYTIDNLPLVIIEKFVDIIFDFNIEINKIALVIDSRSKDFEKIYEIIKLLKDKYYAEVVFLTSDDQTIINRYKETRRKHPIGDDLPEAIKREKEGMSDVRDISDIVLDTSEYNVHQLSAAMENYFKDATASSIYITVQSFGFKYGIPAESDLVLDVRFLKNPHFVKEFRELTGVDTRVKEYIFKDKRTKEMLKKFKPLFDFLLPNYVTEGKKFLTVSIGCTGGKHRSVAIAEEIGKYLEKKHKNKIYIKHRDIDRS